MSLSNCYNFDDFRKLAKKKLPAPIFHYIDGGADDEVTMNRNTDSFNDCDLIPNILNSVGEPDLKTEVFGTKMDMPIFLSPTAMQSLYHPDGDKASARAAEKFGTIYSMSTMASFSIEEIANLSSGPKIFQLYIHKDQSMNWKDAENLCSKWGGHFALKGIMSVEDAKRAVDIGCTGIMVSNHGGRQLDGSRSPFDQVKAISDAVGNKLEIILDGGVRRGTHVLKALAAGATACSFGKAFLFSLSAGGQKGVERLLENMQNEIRRNMILMGCKSIKDLDASKIIYRN